ncbi:MAG TPA: hypothetical protein VNE00_09745 [Paraburkholderia sp.]|nr:hypothetical protein [Paraburkholderia sp.]
MNDLRRLSSTGKQRALNHFACCGQAKLAARRAKSASIPQRIRGSADDKEQRLRLAWCPCAQFRPVDALHATQRFAIAQRGGLLPDAWAQSTSAASGRFWQV